MVGGQYNRSFSGDSFGIIYPPTKVKLVDRAEKKPAGEIDQVHALTTAWERRRLAGESIDGHRPSFGKFSSKRRHLADEFLSSALIFALAR
jgi:hypothetical protein